MRRAKTILTAIAVALTLVVPGQSAQAFCCGFFDGWGGGGFSFGFGFHGRGYGWGNPYWGYPWYAYPGPYAPVYGYPFYRLPQPVAPEVEVAQK